MNFAIRYLSEYRYDSTVTDNVNALRVRPAAGPSQQVEGFEIRVDPQTRLHRRIDHFGTEVTEFRISEPHDQMTIDVLARVATEPRDEPREGLWEDTDTDAYREAGAEFVVRTDTTSHRALDGMLAEVRRETPLATLMALTEMIPARFEYRPGVTHVGSTLDDLLSAGAGVCQDFVQLALALLRRSGIAARYVSGYLYAAPEGGSEAIEVDTHAWVEALMPSEDGGRPVWVGVDPTNDCRVGERHVKIGHGRSYDDVPPIKGVYRGPAVAKLTHRVHMTLTHDGDPVVRTRTR